MAGRCTVVVVYIYRRMNGTWRIFIEIYHVPDGSWSSSPPWSRGMQWRTLNWKTFLRNTVVVNFVAFMLNSSRFSCIQLMNYSPHSVPMILASHQSQTLRLVVSIVAVHRTVFRLSMSSEAGNKAELSPQLARVVLPYRVISHQLRSVM